MRKTILIQAVGLAVLGLVLLAVVTQGATVNITNGQNVDPQTYDPARWLVIEGNPTAQQMTQFKAGTLDLIRFTSTDAVLEDAEATLATCQAAVSQVCGTFVEVPTACRVIPAARCLGACGDSVVIVVTD